jgi:quercetin dioxygenase-like cupin family protein
MATTLNRREVLLGLVGALALQSQGSSLQAQQGVVVKEIKETASRIAGVPKVKLVEVTLQPGAVMPTTKMDQAMVCECTLGSLEVTLDDNKIVTMNKGDIWTCGVGTMEGVANKGNTDGIMRVFILVT